jgi:formylglycine-generating enzyme required for sulfatase activity
MRNILLFTLLPFISLAQEMQSQEIVIMEEVSLILNKIPSGEFLMGSPDNETGRNAEREKLHPIRITRPFWMGATEVTQAQWVAIMENNPSQHRGSDFPVENVSWFDVQIFINKINAKTGHSFRLPTEAEWEYACRAGTKTALVGDMNDYSWNSENSGRTSKKVATKKPNKWGLYDMHGNILEFCSDWFAEDISHFTLNPEGPPEGTNKVMKGSKVNSRIFLIVKIKMKSRIYQTYCS